MKADVILAGVGGQGVLSAAGILSEAARRQGLEVRQGEIHGMSQRGGAVQATLRLADHPLSGMLVPRAGADLLLGLEPLETLRYVPWLSPDGAVVAAAEPFENISDYPPLDEVHARVLALPRARLVEATRLAREAGSPLAANVVLVGAASAFLPLERAVLEAVVEEAFRGKGPRVVEANLRAFEAGRVSGDVPAGAGA
jgi:indolepyruvate ferredoxin oxidoreductase beta subunit